MPEPGKIFVISGASGSGKSTLIRYCMERDPRLVYSISATTRPPRPGEVHGREYFFYTEPEFRKLIAEDQLAEWQEVHGNLYGTPLDFIRRQNESGNSIVLDIDVYGKTKFDRKFPENVGIFILTPSLEVLEERLRRRSTDREADIQLRLRNARDEIEYARQPERYRYFIVNDDRADAAEKLRIVLTWEMEPADAAERTEA
jgi:guanylate kinase